MNMSLYNILISFFLYSFLGWCLEVAFAAVKDRKFVNRGFLNGPVCPIYGFGVTGALLLLMPLKAHWFWLYLASVILCTVLEYFTGLILEKLFHKRWWNYSKMPLNLQGYVCLPFSLIWGVICLWIFYCFNPWVQKMIDLVPKTLGWIFIVCCTIAFIADLIATVETILKLNKRLEMMDDIAKGLRLEADGIGTGISDAVLEGVHLEQDIADKLEKKKTGSAAEAKNAYSALVQAHTKGQSRLLKAFPNMTSEGMQKHLENIKTDLQNKEQKN